jgi:trimethylamine--corrinoid protein Co-methyltransferase
MGMSDTKIIDAQCGLESMGSNFIAALSGANMISGCGMLDLESCLSFEKLVIDAEMIGMAKRFVKGIEVRDNPIALSLMQKSGHKGEFLTLPHTRKWYREEQYLPSELIDRASYEGWKSRGEKSTFERARDRVEKLISSYQPTKITKELRQELRAITLRAGQSFGMQSLPPLPQGE